MLDTSSFTWMSSRLDRNFITVITGQAVDAFDQLFCRLYMTSRPTDLQHIAMDPEPQPEPLPQPVLVVPASATLARKLYNPKYALALGDPSSNPSLTLSDNHNSPKNTGSPENTTVTDRKMRKHRRASKEAIQETVPIHPGLINLEKACLIAYLPTWPEPDPPSDVIGFINIRDSSKPTQVHLQRSEMFEKSQAIRFSSPISLPKETLSEVATPRQVTVKHEEINKLQLAEDETKLKGPLPDSLQPTQRNTQPCQIKSKAEALEHNSPASKPKHDSNTATALTIDNGLQSHPILDAGYNTTPCHSLPHSNNKASTVNKIKPSHATRAVTTNGPELKSLPRTNMKKDITRSNTQTAARNRTHTSQSDLNIGQQITAVLPHTCLHTQPHDFSDSSHNIQIATVTTPLTPTSTSTLCMTTTTSLSSIKPLLNSSSAVSPPVSSSSPFSFLTSTPPIPKPRTIQLLIKDGTSSHGEKPPDYCVIKTHAASTEPQAVHNDSGVAMVLMKKIPEKETEPVPELQNNSRTKVAQKAADFNVSIGEASQQRKRETFSMPAHSMDSLSRTEKPNTHPTLQELTPKARENTHTPENPLRLHFLDTPMPDTRSPTSETLERTPDPRIPKSDRSDGYLSSRTDSTLSTASDEYYECSDSPFHESILLQAVYHSHLLTDDCIRSNSSDATSQSTSSSYINYNTNDATSLPTNSSDSSSESQRCSLSTSISSSLNEMVSMGEEEKNEKTESEVDDKKKKSVVAKRRAVQKSQGSQRSSSKEAKRPADHPKQERPDPVTKYKGSPVQVPKRKQGLNQPAAERLFDGRAASEELSNQKAEPKQASTGGSKPAEDSRVSLPLLPSRPSHPLSGVHPNGAKVPQSSSEDKASPPKRPPTRAPSPAVAGAAGSSSGRKKSESSSSPQLPRQPLVVQGRVKTGKSMNPRPHTSFLHTHSNLLQQIHPHSNNQTASACVTHSQEEGKVPPSFSFTKLYNFKTLKDKMSKLPGQTKRESTSLQGQGQKSTG
ncbi:serine-rich adhesin for platelets-like isoform X2 [Antennarius striatus]|uniref:serine-rich adhesin for platelets-like isoform X2 n=1 Tax=Antennarius striatus TaxID=241820 RepID=UPI0035B4938B